MSERASDRYLNAFAAIERHLRKLVAGSRQDSFYSLVDMAAKKSSSVRRRRDELKEYADLRNAIVHERIDGEPIAEPHDKVVARLEKISELLSNPPRVESAFLGQVSICEPADRVRDVAHKMLLGDFSQLPVYLNQELIGLLTAETLARWLATRFETHGGILEDEPVEAVLPYTEDPENHAMISRTSTVFDVIKCFDLFAHKGKSLDAIVVTQSGSRTEAPLGIITIFDLPRVYELAGERA
jgi:predicted transcriptional regulator